jgi:predicted transcriptional regulator
MELGQLPDIIRPEILNLDEIPDKAVEALALRALGLGSTKIGRLLKISKNTVEGYFRSYDPDGLCKVSREQKRLITSDMLIGTAIEALTEITDEKMRHLNANDLSMIAARCVGAAEKIRFLSKLPDSNKSSRINSMLDSLEVAQVTEE